jgi:hypothetical protein
MSEVHSTVALPFNATSWAMRSQVSRNTSQPSAETWRTGSPSKTSHSGSRRRSGAVTVVLPAPLGPVTTNSGSAGTSVTAPQDAQRSSGAAGSRSSTARGPQVRQKTSDGGRSPVFM